MNFHFSSYLILRLYKTWHIATYYNLFWVNYMPKALGFKVRHSAKCLWVPAVWSRCPDVGSDLGSAFQISAALWQSASPQATWNGWWRGPEAH